MRLLRGLLGALLWIVAGLVGLVGILLCVTVILLPLGIPLVRLAGFLIARAVQLMLPRELAHPVDELSRRTNKLSKRTAKKGRQVGSAVSDIAGDTAKRGRKILRKGRKRLA